MGGKLRIAGRMGPGGSGRTVALGCGALGKAHLGGGRFGTQRQARLPATEQFQIDVRQQLRVAYEYARVTGLNRHATSGDRHDAQYLSVVWRFAPSWETGARVDLLRVAQHEAAREERAHRVPEQHQRRAGVLLARGLPHAPQIRDHPREAVLVGEVPERSLVARGAPVPAVIDGRTCRTPAVPWTAPLANASEVVGDVTRLLPARRLPDGTWLCDNAIRTAHLAGLIDRQAIALVPPGAADGDPVEIVPLPRM